jgi:nitrite reductase (cytochrome c-552)
MEDSNHGRPQPRAAGAPRRRGLLLAALLLVAAGATFAVTALLVSIFEHKQEARVPFLRLVDVNEVSTDPVPWGLNWPHQFDGYRRTVDDVETQYGGSSAMPASKLDTAPWLRRLYSGYAFALDYREARGHAYMLHDQEVTERQTKPQSGACLHCHASIVPTYRRLGLEAMGRPATPEVLAAGFDWPAVMRGFEIASPMSYAEAHAELLETPDGTPGEDVPLFPGGTGGPRTPGGAAAAEPVSDRNEAHPVSCLDCHDPATMQLRITRPGFVRGIAALAEGEAPVPHLPSVERWRQGERDRPYDPNLDASRQEMRSFVCGQCHVEYYCAKKMTLTFPWGRGLRVEDLERVWEETTFPDGTPFHDWVHGETGAPAFKAQHPEFELWSQGVHARSGVACADCHMPYRREGAMKVSSHHVRSPLLDVNNACQTCHKVAEGELRDKVATIQSRTEAHLERAAVAMTDMLDEIRRAMAAGATPEELAPIHELQRKAMWRLDYVSSENSMGFHADQEAVRVLGESIDYSRQAQVRAALLRAPRAPEVDLPREPVHGVTPTEAAPPGPYRSPDREDDPGRDGDAGARSR